MEFIYDEALPRTDALKVLCDQWDPARATEYVSLDQAFGRVTAADVTALYNLPVVRSSRMDGVAVRSADFAAGVPDTSAWEYGRDFARADTGDDFDDEFDAVIAIEEVTFDEAGKPHFPEGRQVAWGESVAPSGSLVHAGDMIAPAHTLLTPELVACAAVGGASQVPVIKRPRVAFMPTGTELLPWGSVPERGQNLEANSLLVSGMLRELGAEPVCYPVIKDCKESLEFGLTRALESADIVIINGGSSRGSEDYNSTMLKERGTYFKHGVRCVPGRPVGMAVIDGKPVINVPGPVAAAWLCMDWLIRGLIAHWFGMPVAEQPRVKATLTEPIAMPKPMERVTRLILSDDGKGGLLAKPIDKKNGPVEQFTKADALHTLPMDVKVAEAGTEVEVELLRPLDYIKAGW